MKSGDRAGREIGLPPSTYLEASGPNIVCLELHIAGEPRLFENNVGRIIGKLEKADSTVAFFCTYLQ